MRLRLTACALISALLPFAACGTSTSHPADEVRSSAAQEPRTTPATQPAARPARRTRFVLAVSVDGLNPAALHKLGRTGAPHLHRLIARGASTLNARTEVERTVTLPNHTGMLTGRRVERRHHGHGVWFNTDSGHTVHRAAGHKVASVFNVVHRHGRKTALFASKPKFALFRRSWPFAIDRFTMIESNPRLVRAVRRDLIRQRRAFTFLHLSLPDEVGHTEGFMSPAYLRAVHRTDARIGELLTTITRLPRLRRHLTVILTADHGGFGDGHGDERQLANFRVPFITWGAGVVAGRDLYVLNRAFRGPRRSRPGYAARRQPIRNGDVANLATSLLGLPAVPGSEHDAHQRLRVR